VRRIRTAELVHLTDEQLLGLRFCDLDLSLRRTAVQSRIGALYGELDARGIDFKPHFWLSSEWFSPDGFPGIAIPFYLAHPRLARLEKHQMLEVEGWGERQCMRILRHETGHTLENAYRLHYRRKWQQLFGSAARAYPKYYQPKPFSRSYVQHLDMWYAQSHPSEDFAETFAVWLNPSSRWRTRYRGWPALRKLEYVDELMKEIAGRKAVVTSRRQIDPLRKLTMTLGEHYAQKRQHYQKWPDFYDNDLLRLFSNEAKYKKRKSAARFLSEIKPELRRLVARWTGEYQYTIEQVLDDIIKRCRELRLRLTRSSEISTLESIVMVTVQTMNYLHGGHHRVAL
jgi:gas vesicle protein